ncbi:hypothetical protein [Arthrobacter sp. H14]|uniref:hypothetical protein n=1 Tax=Arthrobacter sp. H14 TaxID=1312959 RepID=UPI00047C6FC7|nr:hypothetical protein [Arthrobacter sp. H14]
MREFGYSPRDTETDERLKKLRQAVKRGRNIRNPPYLAECMRVRVDGSMEQVAELDALVSRSESKRKQKPKKQTVDEMLGGAFDQAFRGGRQ